jgi:hypothetical protein
MRQRKPGTGLNMMTCPESLEFQAVEVQQKLEELRESGESTWDDLKQGVEKAIDGLKTSVKDLTSKIG